MIGWKLAISKDEDEFVEDEGDVEEDVIDEDEFLGNDGGAN